MSSAAANPIFPDAEVELKTDVALGVAIPSRNARGRIARLGPVIDAILASHDYPPVIEQLLAEAMTLTALLGSLLKEPQGQLTLQAQTEGGIIDLMVCDYLGGELRGYVRHDPERLADASGDPTLQELFGNGYLAITFDQPAREGALPGHRPARGQEPRRGGAKLFRAVRADPEPGPARRGETRRTLVRGRPAAPAPARRRGGPRAVAYAARPSRLAARRDPRRVGESRGADGSRRFRSTISSGGCSTRKRRCGRCRRSRSAAGAAAIPTMSDR